MGAGASRDKPSESTPGGSESDDERHFLTNGGDQALQDREEVVRRVLDEAVFSPLRHGDVVTAAIARIGQAIGMGLLTARTRLPPEARLAELLEISPVTLRSALAVLRDAGLVETHRGRDGGTYVVENAARNPFFTTGDRLAADEVRDLIDVRKVIEGGTALLAAQRASDERLEALSELVDEMQTIDMVDVWRERDTFLHLSIADASGSKSLLRHVAALRGETFTISREYPVPARAMVLANREHLDIVEAIVARDPAQAQHAMTQHIEAMLERWLGGSVA